MTPVVVDASVGVKWFFPETHTQKAERLLTGKYEILVPDFFFFEIASVLWKRVRKNQLDNEQALNLLSQLNDKALKIFPFEPLVPDALDIAMLTRRTVYDCIYLALARKEQTVVVTADERFYNALKNGTYSSFMVWVDDLTP